MRDLKLLSRARKLMEIPDLDISIEEAKSVIKFFSVRKKEKKKFVLRLIEGGKKD
jgi:hypothetical protein|tara:strand:+ start:210 stop:374 length:165 start_codon:yes stop_codon:yes gene_type:complete